MKSFRLSSYTGSPGIILRKINLLLCRGRRGNWLPRNLSLSSKASFAAFTPSLSSSNECTYGSVQENSSHILPLTQLDTQKWVARAVRVCLPVTLQVPQVPDPQCLANESTLAGGKVKPLKAGKKAVKELDDEDKAYQEKKRAGTHIPDP